MTETPAIVIAGGGIVGLSLACALASHDLPVDVIEAEPASPDAGDAEYDLRVYAISPGSRDFLAAIGVWPRVEARRLCPYRRMEVWDAATGGRVHFDSRDLAAAALGYIVEHRVLAAALREHLAGLDSVRLHCPARVAQIEAGAHSVQVRLDSGVVLQAPLLVGADGADSLVRAYAGIAFARRDYVQTAIVANVTTERPHRHTAWQRFLAGGPLAFLPLADGRSSIVWTLPRAEGKAALAITDTEFAGILAAAFEHHLGTITTVSTRRAFPVGAGLAASLIATRIALIGDAAHVIHPLAGQGLNLGLADAAALAASLTGTARDPGSRQVLRRYERARGFDHALMHRATDVLNALFSTTSPPFVAPRRFGMPLVDSVPPVKRGMMRYAMGLRGPYCRAHI